jgi:thiamine-phosphate pyrophosphorylase
VIPADTIESAMLLYYITDRTGFAGNGVQQRDAVLRRIADAARAGVDYIQLREKDLSARDLECLARDAVRAIRETCSASKLLINGRADIALGCGADGVHLPGGALPAFEIRSFWKKFSNREPWIGVSAHSDGEVRDAQANGANFAVLAPIFEKVQTEVRGLGLEALRLACAKSLTLNDSGEQSQDCFAVLALGGVNLSNAHRCLQAGAAGIAGIRLFQLGDISETVRRLRELADPLQ